MHSKKLQVLTQKFTKTVSLFCEIFNTFAEYGVAKYSYIIAKVRELRENLISILHNALFEGVSIITITLVMK